MTDTTLALPEVSAEQAFDYVKSGAWTYDEFDKWRIEGLEAATEAAYSDGLAEGREYGYSAGYDVGHSAGYEAGSAD